MVNRITHRFLLIIVAVVALSALMSLAGPVVDAAIGRGYVEGVVAQLLGGPGNNWVPTRMHSQEVLLDRQQRLRELASDGRYIHTANHIFDPLRDPALPMLGVMKVERAYPSKRGGGYYIVQFEGNFWDRKFEARIRSTGARMVGSLPVNAAVVLATPVQMDQLERTAQVRWTGRYHALYRIDPVLLALTEGEREEQFLDGRGRVTLGVDLFPGERASDYAADVASLKGVTEVQALDEVLGQLSGNIYLKVDARDLAGTLQALSRLGGVRHIGASGNVTLLNDVNRWVHQTYINSADLDIAADVHTNGVTGINQTIAILDTGLENDNCQFRYGVDLSQVTYYQMRDADTADPLANVDQPCNKVIAYYLSEGARKYDPKEAGSPQHGTHVASTIAGDNYRTDSGSNGLAAYCEEDADGNAIMISTGNPPSVHAGGSSGEYDGIAPGAQLLIQDRGGDPGAGLDLATTRVNEVYQAWQSGAEYQNNSFGIANLPTYDTLHSLHLDNALFQKRTMNVTFAAGNTGQEPPPTLAGWGAVAKNPITVGEARDGATGEGMDLAQGSNSGSSRGPTTDGRLKPDLCARGPSWAASAVSPFPADQDIPTAGDLDCDVEYGVGSSFATPVVTGLAALVGQYFQDGYYPSGIATRGQWAIPGMKMELDDGTPLGTDEDSNPNAPKCQGQPGLCDPGTSFRATNALIKAVLINSTRSMTGEDTGSQPSTIDARPNYGQGWGLPVIDDALYFEGDVGTPGGERSGLLVLSDTPNGVSGDEGFELTDVREDVVFKFDFSFSDTNPTEIKEWDVTILPGEPLIVTLAWMDPGEGSVAGQVLRNDLDLEVIGPNPFDPAGDDICWRPNPDVSYTGPASTGFVRDGWIQTETLLQSGEANLWLGKGGATIPDDKDLWPDFASADRFNNVEQIAIRADEVTGGTYQIRIVNWNLRGSSGSYFPEGEPDFEVDGKGNILGRGTDDIPLDEQGFALILTGNFATDQGVISFNKPFFTCGGDDMARITLRDQNGCDNPNPVVVVTTNTPSPSFPADYEELALIPDFPCSPVLPPDDPAQPKVWRTGEFPIINSGNPNDVILGDKRITLMAGQNILARYDDTDPPGGVSTARAALRCSASFRGDGYVLEGGCDLAQPTLPEAPDNPKVPDQFMDADELIEYTAFFVNTGTQDFSDVYATLSQVDPTADGDGAEMEVLNNPVYVGKVPAGRRASATFLVQMAPRDPAGPVQPQERIIVEVALTSPADNLIDPQTFQEQHKIESDLQEYWYNTRDTTGELFGQGLVEELKPGRNAEEGPDAYRTYDDMLIDPGPDGNYESPPGGPPEVTSDDDWSLNYLRLLPMGAIDPWDFDDDEDGWNTYGDPQFDVGAPSHWIWAGDRIGLDNAGGCGWADNYPAAPGTEGDGIWHTGIEGYAPGIGGEHLLSSPRNMGPDPDRAFDDIFTAPNNQPPVCATYQKAPVDPSSPFYLWYLNAPRIYKTTRSPEFRVAWQHWTIYSRIFGHITNYDENYTAFAFLTHNEPINSPQPSFRPFEVFSGIYASAAGAFVENPVLGDWNDDTDNAYRMNLAVPNRSFPDRSYEDYYGPPSTDGWQHALLWWLTLFRDTPVPNRYGMGVSDSSFVWTESRDVEDQTDCALTFQKAIIFFNQQRYNLCEGVIDITVIDRNQPNLGFVYVNINSDQELPPGETVKLIQTSDDPRRYEGRLPFSVDPRKDIRGVLAVSSGFVDVGLGADVVTGQYDPREPQDNSDLGVPDWLDDGSTSPGCSDDAPDLVNDDFRNNCTGDLMDALSMTITPDDDGDTCPDGDGVPDAQDDCDSLLGLDDPLCETLQDNCPAGGYEANDFAWVNCPSGALFYISHGLIDIDGDGDMFADRNEELFLTVDLLNLRTNDLYNSTVRITTQDDTICILDDDSFYGDIPGVTTARLEGMDRRDQIMSTPATNPVTGETNYFRIGVPSETVTASLDAVQRAGIRVDVYADNFATAGTDYASMAPLTFELFLDLDEVANGLAPDFFETFCDASGAQCANPPGKLNQPWYTEQGFWADPGSGIVYVDSTQKWPDNEGFCPECDFYSPTQCSTTDFVAPATEPPCDYKYDGTGPAGNPDYIDDWHVETLGDGVDIGLGTTKSGQNAIHFGDHSLQSYHNGQLSALTLPPLAVSNDPTVTPELSFWHMAEFWGPNFTSGLSTPIGLSQVQINADYRPTDAPGSFPETSWQRLDPFEEGGNYNTYSDVLIACRGLLCEYHQPVFQEAGDYSEDGAGVNGAGLTGRWAESIVDLSDFRGKVVKIRFLISVLQDIHVPLGNNRGWIIDDITVSNVASKFAPHALGYQLEQDPLPDPGPCGLQASFTVAPLSTCLSSPVQFADTHVGLGLPDGAGGREPIAYEWDFDGDGTPEIDCSSDCLQGEDVLDPGHLNPLPASIAEVLGNCEAPLVTFAQARNYTAVMKMCQAGVEQDSATHPVRVRDDLDASNVGVSIDPLIAKGSDPLCPVTAPGDLNGDMVVDATDQQIWDEQYIGCIYHNTRIHSIALISGGTRDLNYCWANEGNLVCGDRNGENFYRYGNLGPFPDYLTTVDTQGGCSYTVPLGLLVIPGADFQITNITISDQDCGSAFENGFIDPGEFIHIEMDLQNNGAGAVTELVGQLRTRDSQVSIHKVASRVMGPGGSYTILPGETGTAVFEFLVSDLRECKGVLDFNLDLYNWSRTMDDTMNFVLPVGQSTPASEIVTDTDRLGDVSGNPYVCDPGCGDDISNCPNPPGPADDCCPARQAFETDTGGSNGAITDVCLSADIVMNGIVNRADQLNVTLIGPAGQSYPVLSGNTGGQGCSRVTIELCTQNDLGDELTLFRSCESGVDTAPVRTQSFYEEFRASFRNSDSGATWYLRVEDARKTALDFNPSMWARLDSFSVDVDYTTAPICVVKALQDNCLTDEYGPIFGGVTDASGCSAVSVVWLSALDQEDMNGDRRPDTVPMSYDVYRGEAASCDIADAPAVGALSLEGTADNSTIYIDTNVTNTVGAYWYRVVATDASGHGSDDPTIPNPDGPDYWGCTEMMILCPDPIEAGIMHKSDAGGVGEISIEILSNTGSIAGLRLYRGTFFPVGGFTLSRSNQNHQVIDAILGNCYEPSGTTRLADDDINAANYGTGSFYYLVVPLVGDGITPYNEGPLDTLDFPGNAQAAPRIPPGDNDCNP